MTNEQQIGPRLRRSLVLCTLSCVVAGCGDRSQAELFPVKGVVLLDEKPLPSGTVITMPEKGRGAQGAIDAMGRFSLTTRELGEGAVPGRHQVAVIATAGATSTGVNPEAEIRFTIPPRYSQTASSGLEILVHADEPNEVTLRLTSARP